MTAFWKWKRWAVTIGSVLLGVGTPGAGAQATQRVQPQATSEDVLASLVHHSAVIFAGEVYAIRMPPGVNGASSSNGLPSSHADAVDVEFRVDMGIRGTSIGNNFVLHMPLASWQQSAPPFALHQHAVTFLLPADAAGLTQPVQGEADLPGMDLGVMPVDKSTNQVDLTRLRRMVTDKTLTTMPSPGAPIAAPSVAYVTTTQGQDTLVSGLHQGRMAELRNDTVPFLALVRDVSVVSAAETQSRTNSVEAK